MDTIESAPQQYLPPKTSGLAIASLILGICSFCTLGITGIIGLILGIVGLSAIRKDPVRLRGNGLAIAGIALSCAGFASVLLQVALFLPVLSRARTQGKRADSLNNILLPTLTRAQAQGKRAVSLSNLKQLSLAAIMYSDDNDGKFPPSENWPETLRPYYKNDSILKSPFDPEAGRGYAMNANLDNRKMSDIQRPQQVVLFFECRFGSPPGGGPELLPEPPRAGRGYTFSFLDGHTECVRQERVENLIWEP